MLINALKYIKINYDDLLGQYQIYINFNKNRPFFNFFKCIQNLNVANSSF